MAMEQCILNIFCISNKTWSHCTAQTTMHQVCIPTLDCSGLQGIGVEASSTQDKSYIGERKKET